MSEHLPESIEKLHKSISGALDKVDQFRGFVKLLDASYKEIETSGKQLVKQERKYQKLKEDHAFFARHRNKVDVLFRAMRETYSNPAKALRHIDELARNYPAQYVFEVAHLGSWRLGSVQGWAFLNLKSVARVEADRNYTEAVLPALGNALPDHKDYLDLRSEGIEERLEAELDKMNDLRRSTAAVQAGMTKWTEEMTALAAALSKEEVGRLNSQEAEVCRRLVESGGSALKAGG